MKYSQEILTYTHWYILNASRYERVTWLNVTCTMTHSHGVFAGKADCVIFDFGNQCSRQSQRATLAHALFFFLGPFQRSVLPHIWYNNIVWESHPIFIYCEKKSYVIGKRAQKFFNRALVRCLNFCSCRILRYADRICLFCSAKESCMSTKETYISVKEPYMKYRLRRRVVNTQKVACAKGQFS